MAAPSKPPSPRSAQVQLDRGLRRDVGKLSLLFTGVGSIIGSGWLFGALTASQIAGPAAIFAWIIGGLMIMIIGLSYAELGVMFPVAGGVVRFPQYAFGSFAGYTGGWITWLAAASVPAIEVLAVVQYSSPYLPWLGGINEAGAFELSFPAGLLVGVGLMFFFCVVNVLGVKAFAQFNNVLVWWKLGVILLVIVAFFAAAFHPGNLTAGGGFAPEGAGGMLTAVVAGGIAFSYLGFRQGVEFAGETTNPQKNVPFAIVGAILITMVIYVGLQIAFITALPPDFLANGWGALGFENEAGPLAGIALILGMGWLAVLLYADAIISPGDTGVIYTAVTSRLAFANGQNGNSPNWLTSINRFGVPWLAVVLTFVVGCFFFLPFPGWSQLVGFVVAATALSFGTGPLVVGALRRQLPDQERPFKLPGGDTIPYLAFLCTNLIVLWNGWTTNWKIGVAVLLGYVVLIVHHNMNRATVPPLDFNASLPWILTWFLGLGLISFLSGYGESGLGVLPNPLAMLLIAVLSGIVYYIAIQTKLSPERAAENIERTPSEVPKTSA